MRDNFVREKMLEEKKEKQVHQEIMKAIIETKQDLAFANQNYEYAQGDLIDYYVYEIKANRARLDYLMKKAKSKSIALDRIHEIQMRMQEDKVV